MERISLVELWDQLDKANLPWTNYYWEVLPWITKVEVTTAKPYFVYYFTTWRLFLVMAFLGFLIWEIRKPHYGESKDRWTRIVRFEWIKFLGRGLYIQGFYQLLVGLYLVTLAPFSGHMLWFDLALASFWLNIQFTGAWRHKVSNLPKAGNNGNIVFAKTVRIYVKRVLPLAGIIYTVNVANLWGSGPTYLVRLGDTLHYASSIGYKAPGVGACNRRLPNGQMVNYCKQKPWITLFN